MLTLITALMGCGNVDLTDNVAQIGDEPSAEKVACPRGMRRWGPDADGDGFGASPLAVCSSRNLRPLGFVPNAQDCDDTDAAVSPGATETCNGVDDDCNKVVDDGETTWYPDVDGDGFGDDGLDTVIACDQPTGYIADNTDCNDTNADVHPGATEVCILGESDVNCDGVTDVGEDDSDADGYTWCYMYYTQVDADGDGFCDGGVDNNHDGDCTDEGDVIYGEDTTPPDDVIDCDLTDATVYPGATEIADGVDNNCDGVIDEGLGEVCVDFNSSVVAGEVMVRVEHADWTNDKTYWGLDQTGAEVPNWTDASVVTESRGYSSTDDQLSELIFVSDATIAGETCATMAGLVSTDVLVLNGLVLKTDLTYYWMVGASFTYVDSLTVGGVSSTTVSGNDYRYDIP